MKKSLLVFSVVLFGLVLALPAIGDAGRGRGGGGYRGGSHGGYRGGFHGGYRGWYGPRVFVGVSPLYAPWYYYAPVPPPVYVVPPVYGVDQPPPVAYPDPAYGQQYGSEGPPGGDPQQYSQSPPASGGEWVTVPGQWVQGTWIPEHQVQLPRN